MDFATLLLVLIPWIVVALAIAVLFRGIRAMETLIGEIQRLGERLDVSDRLRDHFAGFQSGVDNSKLLESMNRRMSFFEDAMTKIIEARPGRDTMQIVGRELRMAVKNSRLSDLNTNLESKRRQLSIWEQNLNRLHEQKAMQGTDVDIRLINQIESTGQAIHQARQEIRAIEDEIDAVRVEISREEFGNE